MEIHDNTMKLLPDGQRFNLKTAVRFTSEVAGGGDALKLVGKVKDMDQVTELSGEYSQGSVVLGDNAYEVVDGFVGEAIVDSKFVPAPSEKDSHSNEDVDLLAKFFMQSKRK